MSYYSPSVEKLIESFEKLPSIGHKTAVRLAFYMLNASNDETEAFIKSIQDAKKNLKLCSKCYNISDTDPCEICSNSKRDNTKICVVEDVKDVVSIEKIHEYNGLYHVLGGVISISKGKTIDDLNIDSLVKRLKEHKFNEVILATNPTIEGETTALYIAKLISPFVDKITRLAYGLQMGGNLDYTDSLTLSKAIEGRREIK